MNSLIKIKKRILSELIKIINVIVADLEYLQTEYSDTIMSKFNNTHRHRLLCEKLLQEDNYLSKPSREFLQNWIKVIKYYILSQYSNQSRL